VRVVRGRAEDLHGKATYDVVTSRAVAPLERLLAWSMPLVAPTGALVAMKGQSVHEEIAASRTALRRWKCREPEVFEVGVGLVDPPTTVLRVPWADPSRIGWPLAREGRPSPGGGRSGKRKSKREVS
jgi:16S rRNA (guanine527-N7)-methyltransferase